MIVLFPVYAKCPVGGAATVNARIERTLQNDSQERPEAAPRLPHTDWSAPESG